MSTAKSSGAGGFHFNEIGAQCQKDEYNQKYYHNKFDETLENSTGDITVIMRVSDDSVLLEKVLMFFKSLADKINLSIHEMN
jgi:hypothetical protein